MAVDCKKEKVKRIIALVLGFVENVLFGCLCHGWPSLVYVFKQDGIYVDLCLNSSKIYSNNDDSNSNFRNETLFHDNSFVRNLRIDDITWNNTSIPADYMTDLNTSCPARDQMLNLAYTISVMTMMLTGIGLGKFFDKFGMRAIRLIGSVIFIPGCLFLACVDRERSWMIFPGLIMISLAGTCIIIANNHLTLMAGPRKSTVASLYSGGVDTSGGVFLVVKVLWEAGVGRRVSLGILTGLWLLVIVDSFALFPKFKVKIEESERLGIDKKFPLASHHDVPTLKECLRNPVFITLCVWISLLNLRMCCFFGTFNPWINEITGHDTEKVSRITSLFYYILFSGILFTPLVGLAMDWCKKRLFTNINNMSGNSFASMPVLFMHCTVAVLFSISVLIPQEFFAYVSFFFFVIFRSCLFAIYYSFLNLVIPREHYGIMLGIATSCAGIFSLLQFPLLIWAEKSLAKFTPMNIFLLVISALSLAHPICICIMNRRKDNRAPIDQNDNLSRAERLLGIKAQKA